MEPVKYERILHILNIIVILLFGIAAVSLSLNQNIWTDEAFTMQLLREDFTGIISGTAADVLRQQCGRHGAPAGGDGGHGREDHRFFVLGHGVLPADSIKGTSAGRPSNAPGKMTQCGWAGHDEPV